MDTRSAIIPGRPQLLERRSSDSQLLRTRILQAVKDSCAVNFWKHDFDLYTRADLITPQLLLSKLLMAENVGVMLSQRGSSFSLRDVMEQGKVLLVDLSAVASEIKGVLGGLILSLLSAAAKEGTIFAEPREPDRDSLMAV